MDTVDGRNPANQFIYLMSRSLVGYPSILQGFDTSKRWLAALGFLNHQPPGNQRSKNTSWLGTGELGAMNLGKLVPGTELYRDEHMIYRPMYGFVCNVSII